MNKFTNWHGFVNDSSLKFKHVHTRWPLSKARVLQRKDTLSDGMQKRRDYHTHLTMRRPVHRQMRWEALRSSVFVVS